MKAAWVTILIAGVVACERPELPGTAPGEIAGVDAGVLEELPAGVTRNMVEEGEQLYRTCSVCHGTEGRGTQLGPRLRGSDRLPASGAGDGTEAIEAIEAIVRTGAPTTTDYPVPMPEMGGAILDAAGLRALASYVYALSHSRSEE